MHLEFRFNFWHRVKSINGGRCNYESENWLRCRSVICLPCGPQLSEGQHLALLEGSKEAGLSGKGKSGRRESWGRGGPNEIPNACDETGLWWEGQCTPCCLALSGSFLLEFSSSRLFAWLHPFNIWSWLKVASVPAIWLLALRSSPFLSLSCYRSQGPGGKWVSQARLLIDLWLRLAIGRCWQQTGGRE